MEAKQKKAVLNGDCTKADAPQSGLLFRVIKGGVNDGHYFSLGVRWRIYTLCVVYVVFLEIHECVLSRSLGSWNTYPKIFFGAAKFQIAMRR